jgi:hypothetical protein
MPCVSDILSLFSKYVEICRILLESLLMSKYVENCRFLVYMADIYRVSVECFEVVYEVRRSHSTVVPSAFDSQSYFLNSDGPTTFDSRLRVSVFYRSCSST